jgi:hypothetical protein
MPAPPRLSPLTRRPTLPIATLAALCMGILCAVFSPSEAQAQCDTTISNTLVDGDGKIWAFGNRGQVVTGSPSDAFDAAFVLSVGVATFPTVTPTVSGQTITWGPQVMSGLDVTRKAYVPNTAGEGFVRYLESFHNPAAAGTPPITVTVTVATNHAFTTPGVINTSDGDSTIEASDSWIAIQDSATPARQRLGFVAYGDTALVPGRPTSANTNVFTCTGTTGYQVTYSLTVSPGDTLRLMHFGVQDSVSPANTVNAIDSALGNHSQYLAGVTQEERTSLVNWGPGLWYALVATDDAYTTLEDQPLTVVAASGVFVNDLRLGGPTSLFQSNLAGGTTTGFTPTTGAFTFTPTANFNGASGFTYRHSRTDFDGLLLLHPHMVATAVVNVTPVNDKPSFTFNLASIVRTEDSAGYSASIGTFNSGATNETQTPTYTLVLETIDTTLTFSAAPSTTGSTLTFTPAANAYGVATYSVTVNDGGGTANGGVDTSDPRILTITVNAANDPPTIAFSPTNPPTINEDAGAQTIAGFATVTPGPNEASQTVTLSTSVIATTGTLAFSVAPSIAANGTLTYTPLRQHQRHRHRPPHRHRQWRRYCHHHPRLHHHRERGQRRPLLRRHEPPRKQRRRRRAIRTNLGHLQRWPRRRSRPNPHLLRERRHPRTLQRPTHHRRQRHPHLHRRPRRQRLLHHHRHRDRQRRHRQRRRQHKHPTSVHHHREQHQ